MINWLTIELTNDCQKSCHFCGRAKARKEGLRTGNLSMEIFDLIISQFKGSLIQFHRDGEPLLYPALSEIGEKCKPFITNIVTNGRDLLKRVDDLKDFTTITVSVYEDDKEQFEQIKGFKEKTETPRLLVKYLGNYTNPEFENMGITTLRRTIHAPKGDVNYQGNKPPVPEFGICLDFLMKPSIDYEGNFFICNRYDPFYEGMIGNIKNDTFEELWNSPLRLEWLEYHKQGRRDKISLCKKCQYWGCPAS